MYKRFISFCFNLVYFATMTDTAYVSTAPPSKRRRVEPKTPTNGFAAYNVYAFVAPCGGGKTHACAQLIRQQCEDGQVKRVYIVAPTVRKNHAWDAIYPWIEDTCDKAGDAEEFLHNMRKRCVAEYDFWESIRRNYKRDDFADILQGGKRADGFDTLVREFAKKQGPSWYEDAPCTALICDDCMGTDLFSYGRTSTFANMLIRHRHLALNVYILVQGLKNTFPRHLRLNVRCWLLWRFGDKRIVKDLFSEGSGALCCEEEFIEMYNAVTGRDINGDNLQTRGQDFLIMDAKSKHSFRAGLNVAAKTPQQLLTYCNQQHHDHCKTKVPNSTLSDKELSQKKLFKETMSEFSHKDIERQGELEQRFSNFLGRPTSTIY